MFRHSFDNTPSNGLFQDYNPPLGVQLTARPFTSLGFGPGSDSAWDIGLDPVFSNIPHTASNLTIDIYADGAGFQGGANESWGIDNLNVVVNGVRSDRCLDFRGVSLIGESVGCVT